MDKAETYLTNIEELRLEISETARGVAEGTSDSLGEDWEVLVIIMPSSEAIERNEDKDIPMGMSCSGDETHARYMVATLMGVEVEEKPAIWTPSQEITH